jgi:hypothetical protein
MVVGACVATEVLDEFGFEVFRLPVGVCKEDVGVELLRLRKLHQSVDRETERARKRGKVDWTGVSEGGIFLVSKGRVVATARSLT